jgi:hypothetical protein
MASSGLDDAWHRGRDITRMNSPVQAANGSLGAAGQPRRIFDSDSAREGASLARGMSAHAAALRAAAAAGPAALPAGATTGS